MNHTSFSNCFGDLASMKPQESGKPPRRLLLHHSKGFNVVNVQCIIRLEADGSYTTLYIHESPTLIVSKPIGELEPLLDTRFFLRVHKSHIINIHYLDQYVYEDAGYAILLGGHKVEVSRRKTDLLFDRLSELSVSLKRKGK